MPKGEGVYYPLCREINREHRARGCFLLVLGGELGDDWALWAPPEVAAQFPTLLHDAAQEIEAKIAGNDDPGVIQRQSSRIAIVSPNVDSYQDRCEWIVKRASAEFGFVYVLEGDQGTGWSAFGAPSVQPLVVSELLHAIARDITILEPGESKPN